MTESPQHERYSPPKEDRVILETIASLLLRTILPACTAVGLVMIGAQLILSDQTHRIVPVAVLSAFSLCLFLFSRSWPQLRVAQALLLAILLFLGYSSWSQGTFRLPGMIGLTAVTIVWACLFTPRKLAFGILALLLGYQAVLAWLIHTGSLIEHYQLPSNIAFIALTIIYGLLFVSIRAPVATLFESVAASRKAEHEVREALSQLQESRNFTVQAVDHSRQLFGWLTPDGILQYANATSLGMIGAKSSDILGLPFWDTPWFCHDPDEQEKLRLAIARAASGEFVRYEVIHRLPNGGAREIDFSVHPIFGRDGSVSMLVAEGRDATEENQTMRQKELLSERLHQSQKMEVIGQLTGGVAHDFNNNLSSIGGLAELLKTGVADEAQRLEYLDMILEATSNASSLTRRLLAFSRKEIHKLDKPVDLVSLLKNVASLLQRTQDKRVMVSVVSQLECAIILCDESMLQNAFLNMGINAFHAMPNGGRLDFRLVVRHLEATDCDLLNPAIFPGKYFELAISDTGCGMPPEVAQRIFEPFYTTKEAGKGTGLGMSMVYDTLKELGGSIAVDSKLGVGTTIRVYLPSPPSVESTPD